MSKRAMKVQMIWINKTRHYFSSQYKCPACRCLYQDCISDKRILSFRCDCGQVLIIEEVKQ
jgi:hypothetical protein